MSVHEVCHLKDPIGDLLEGVRLDVVIVSVVELGAEGTGKQVFLSYKEWREARVFAQRVRAD